MQPGEAVFPDIARKGLGPVGGAAAGLISSISGCSPSGLGCFGPKSEEVGERGVRDSAARGIGGFGEIWLHT